jgi:hypothetical protein
MAVLGLTLLNYYYYYYYYYTIFIVLVITFMHGIYNMYLKQTMFLWHIVLQLFCIFNL